MIRGKYEQGVNNVLIIPAVREITPIKIYKNNLIFSTKSGMCKLSINASRHSKVFLMMSVQNIHSGWLYYLLSTSVYYTRPNTVVAKNTNKSGFQKTPNPSIKSLTTS